MSLSVSVFVPMSCDLRLLKGIFLTDFSLLISQTKLDKEKILCQFLAYRRQVMCEMKSICVENILQGFDLISGKDNTGGAV